MNTTFKISNDLERAIMVRTFHNHKKRPQKEGASTRKESVFGTKSYRDALQRAFNKAKEQIYFNPDMKYFVTLTYRGTTHTIDDVMHDMKVWLKHERRNGNKDIKYMWIAEYQKRGSIHIHMISNAQFDMRINKNGHKEISYWADRHGFTSVLHIDDFDNNFKPYLYLFKYMRKTERIGRSFIHTSRNLNDSYFTAHAPPSPDDLINWTSVLQERSETFVETTRFVSIRNFMCYDEFITKDYEGNNSLWVKSIKLLQFMKVSEKNLKNPIPL